MREMNGKPVSEMDYLYARLDQIQMSSHERLRAKASLARAEAIADLMAGFGSTVKHLLNHLVVRPIRRLTTQIG